MDLSSGSRRRRKVSRKLSRGRENERQGGERAGGESEIGVVRVIERWRIKWQVVINDKPT